MHSILDMFYILTEVCSKPVASPLQSPEGGVLWMLSILLPWVSMVLHIKNSSDTFSVWFGLVVPSVIASPCPSACPCSLNLILPAAWPRLDRSEKKVISAFPLNNPHPRRQCGVGRVVWDTHVHFKSSITWASRKVGSMCRAQARSYLSLSSLRGDGGTEMGMETNREKERPWPWVQQRTTT